jgi:hypothetical protein
VHQGYIRLGIVGDCTCQSLGDVNQSTFQVQIWKLDFTDMTGTIETKFRQVTDSIWTFSRPFLRVNLFKIGGRATAVRLSNGDIFLISPTQPDETTKATLDKIGKVKYLVAPDYEVVIVALY